jgi:hypothetical protein
MARTRPHLPENLSIHRLTFFTSNYRFKHRAGRFLDYVTFPDYFRYLRGWRERTP